MNLITNVKNALAALSGRSIYTPDPRMGLSLSDPSVERARIARGGQIQPIPITQTRWMMGELEDAVHQADSGYLYKAGVLWRAMRQDADLVGIASTRSKGLLQLPKQFRGNPAQRQLLDLGSDSVRSVFDEMFPVTDAALFVEDLCAMGVAVGELLPVEGRSYPVFSRLDPAYLFFSWNDGNWYYMSNNSLIQVEPGDGRWVMAQIGRVSPWQNGLWRALAKSWISKVGSEYASFAYQSSLANPARVVHAPVGASNEEKAMALEEAAAWGYQTTLVLPIGWDLDVKEVTGGTGWQAHKDQIERSNAEYAMAWCGQTVTAGGTGPSAFTNMDIFRSVKDSLIQWTGESLAYVCNTQIIPPFVLAHFGESGLDDCATVHWDTRPPKDRNIEAQALISAAGAIKALTEALRPFGREPDIVEICDRFGVPSREVTKLLATTDPDKSSNTQSNSDDIEVDFEDDRAA